MEKPAHWDAEQYKCPTVWKAIGDEIVFCATVWCLDHLAVCLASFLKALSKYGSYLDSMEDLPLDIKAYGWIAAFPFPNVTVRIFDTVASADRPELPDEENETGADSDPANFDFLGKEIDAGFRTGRHCSAEKLSMSIELAWLITKYNNAEPLKGIAYTYGGSQELKGVLDNRPYPIISIDVERNNARQKVRDKEKKIRTFAQITPSTFDFHDFLNIFMDVENVSKPWLPINSLDKSMPAQPSEYIYFQNNWNAIYKELQERAKGEVAASQAEGEVGVLDEAISSAATRMVDQAAERD